MIELGQYLAKDGKEYDCYFVPDEKIAKAVGPLPEGDQVGSPGVAFAVQTVSKEEAKMKLAEAIGSGYFV